MVTYTKNNNKLTLIIVIFLIIIAFSGSTFAYLSWQTSESLKTNVVFDLEQDFWCAADGGGDITSNEVEIAPASCTNNEHAIMRRVTITPTILREGLSINMNLWLNIDSIDEAFSRSKNLRWSLNRSLTSCIDGVIATGNFYGMHTGDKLQILEKTFAVSTPETYSLYIWLDAEESDTSTMRKNFSFSIGGSCNDTPQDNSFYAVYSTDDTSLRFYQEEENVINVGNTYEGRTVTAVYKMTGYENFNLANTILPPWSEYANDITTIVVEDKITPNNVQFWFVNLTKVKSVDVTNLDTSKLTSIRGLFYAVGRDSTELTITGLHNFDTSNMIEMSGAFIYAGHNASYVNIGDLSSWDVSRVAQISLAFYKLGYSAQTLILSGLNNWDVSNVTDMDQTFYYTGQNANWHQDLSSWNVKKVKTHTEFNAGVETKVIAPIWTS